jgi:hypothetical protein
MQIWASCLSQLLSGGCTIHSFFSKKEKKGFSLPSSYAKCGKQEMKFKKGNVVKNSW